MAYQKQDYMKRLLEIFVLFLLALHNCGAFDKSKVIYAKNAGGQAHYDCLGIKYDSDPYDSDPLKKKPGGTSKSIVASSPIRRVPKEDYELYQVHRYSSKSSFSYYIPVIEDGDYVLVLKFCETYFTSRSVRTFDVSFGNRIIIKNLDVFDKVGNSTAHDEYIPFSIKDGLLVFKDSASPCAFAKEPIELRFSKGKNNNPMISAILVYKGKVNDFPKLRPLLEEEKPDHRRIKDCGCSNIYYDRSRCYSDFSDCISGST